MMEKAEKAPFFKYREVTGKSADEMAELLGVDRATIFRWENGKPPIPVNRLADAEKATGIPRRDLRPDIFAPSIEKEREAS